MKSPHEIAREVIAIGRADQRTAHLRKRPDKPAEARVKLVEGIIAAAIEADRASDDKVRELYAGGMTQNEVAVETGLTQKVVWNLMRRHGIPCRAQVKRDQRGPRNSSWKGDRAKYAALHLRVAAARGKPSLCEHCGTTKAKRFEWASLTKNYKDVNDFVRLCASCHHKMDGTIHNITGKEVRP